MQTVTATSLPETLDGGLAAEHVPNAVQVLEQLSRVDLFRSMPPDEVQMLLGLMTRVEAPEGTRVVEEGEPGDAMYLIEHGQARVHRKDGTEISILGHGDVFGEMAL